MKFDTVTDHVDGRVVKASDSRAARLGSVPAFAVDPFPGRVIPVTEKLVF